jgi:hypothetical protein
MIEPPETTVPLTLPAVLAVTMRRYEGRPGGLTDKTKTTYLYSYKNYLTWLCQNINNTAMALTIERSIKGDVYATQQNTDMYYLHYVPENIRGKKSNAKRYLYAIQWFRQYLEYPDGTPIVLSSTIRTALGQQEAIGRASAAITFAGVDPHKGLRDIMPEADNLRIVNYIWKSRTDYADLLFCYLWGRNAGVRGASARTFQLCDLNVSVCYGPEETPPRNRTLLLILRQGTRHKEKSTIDKSVGVQRHKDYRQCAVFATGVLVIKQLQALGTSISFTQHNKKQDANWWGCSLNNYSDLNEHSGPMKEVFAKTGVDPNCKITHHRLQAVLLGASKGLDDRQISTYTKHKTDKLSVSYLPDCERTALKVMSGFSLTDVRYVKEEHVTFPSLNGFSSKYVEQFTEYLIPEYKEYVAQANSAPALADTSLCCKTFLGSVLPFLVETVLQNGIFFIRDYPTNEFALILKVRMMCSIFLYVTLYVLTY